MVRGKTFAPDQPTCGERTYDYFVVSCDLAHAVAGVVRLEDGGCKPHWTTRLYLNGAARAKAVRRLAKPQLVPGVLPHGPLGKSDTEQCETPSASMSQWYCRARSAWHSLMASPPTWGEHKFRWESATGRVARKHAGATTASAALRALARIVDDSIHLVRKGVDPLDPIITAHAAAALRACGKKEMVSPDVNVATLRILCLRINAVLVLGQADAAEKLLRPIAKKADMLEERHTKDRKAQWRAALSRPTPCCRRQSGHGERLSRLAYRWVKGVAGWSRSSIGPAVLELVNPDATPGDAPVDIPQNTAGPSASTDPSSTLPDPCLAPCSDQAEVDATAAAWADLWNSKAPYLQPEFPGIDDDTTPPLVVEDILRAAASFPVTTGLGADNFSPRAVLRLPRHLVAELADLLNAAETAGSWDEALSLVLIVLLPKEGGGHRPIGLFPSVIRIWMRARSTIAREWETETAGPEFFGCQGMGAQRAAWSAAFEAEAATLVGQDPAAAMLDLVKAFEMISHQDLVRAAKEVGFSLRVLRMSLAAYRIARTVGVDLVYSRQVTATKGITAGSGMATSELRMLLTETIFAVRKAWPVKLKLYVDDLTIAASGDGYQIACNVSAATDMAVAAFRKLGFDVNVKKSVAVANRPRVLATMLQHCRSGVLTATRATKLLGTSFAAGAGRAVAVLRDRIAKVKKVAHRAQELSRLGLSAVEYVRGAAIPAMLYGCEVTGVSDSMTHDACIVAAAALTPLRRERTLL